VQDLDADPVELKFTVNGEDQGVAYSIDPNELKGCALFPHILSKNCAFQVNFGEQQAWATSLPGFTYVGSVAVADRTPGPKRPAKREECEVGKNYLPFPYNLQRKRHPQLPRD